MMKTPWKRGAFEIGPCADNYLPVVLLRRSTMLSGAFRQCVSFSRVVLKPQQFRPLLVGGKIHTHPSLTDGTQFWHACEGGRY